MSSIKRQDMIKRIAIAVMVTAIGLIIPLFVMDNRPFIYQRHEAYMLEQPVDLNQYTFHDMTGKDYMFMQFNGKPSIVVFFATWCGICARELPKAAEFYDRNKDHINVIPIAIPEDSPEKVNWFYERFGGGNLPAFIAHDQTLHRLLKVIGIPKFFLVDANGKAIAKMYPVWQSPDMQELLDRLLAEGNKATVTP